MISEDYTSILQPQEAKLFRESINLLFQNDFRKDRIVSDIEKVETTFEFKFSRDLIRYILHEHMTDLQWIPTGMFTHHDLDSPFTPQFKGSIMAEVNAYGYNIIEVYEKCFPDKSKVAENHKEKCNLFMNLFLSKTFSHNNFLKLCTFLSVSAGLSYLCGSHLAPYQSFLTIIKSVKTMIYLQKADDIFWNVIQDWVERHEYEWKRVTRPTFPKVYFRHGGLHIKAEMEDQTTLEYKFGRDLIRFILDEYLTYLYWFPTGIFAENNHDSPFTPQMKEATKKVLDSFGKKYQMAYDNYFPDKSKVVENYEEYCKDSKNNFVNSIFFPNIFIEFSAFLGISAGLSYYYGARFAPYQALETLLTAVNELKYLGKADDNLWNEVRDWLDRVP